MMPAILANARRMHRSGGQIIGGSDAGIAPSRPHDLARFAVGALIELGMTPADALRAWTSQAAVACGLGDRKGRIAPGYDADLLAVDGDPLHNPAALHHIRAVYLRGTHWRLNEPDTAMAFSRKKPRHATVVAVSRA